MYVWATGNGGLTDDDCNCDGYTTSIYTISIGCISDHGLSAYYTELCSSTLAVTFNGGSHREKEENKIVCFFSNNLMVHKCIFRANNSMKCKWPSCMLIASSIFTEGWIPGILVNNFFLYEPKSYTSRLQNPIFEC